MSRLPRGLRDAVVLEVAVVLAALSLVTALAGVALR